MVLEVVLLNKKPNMVDKIKKTVDGTTTQFRSKFDKPIRKLKNSNGHNIKINIKIGLIALKYFIDKTVKKKYKIEPNINLI